MNDFSSASVYVVSPITPSPLTSSRQVRVSITGDSVWLRTKNRSFGVR